MKMSYLASIHNTVSEVLCWHCFESALPHSTLYELHQTALPTQFVRNSLLTNTQQKNTCAHNNTQKAHANGIKKRKRTKYVSTRGMDPKFLRNQKFCKKWNGSKRPEEE